MSDSNPNEPQKLTEKEEREMEAFGYNTGSPTQVAKFRESQAKLADDKITKAEFFREMNATVYLEEDKKARDDAQQKQQDAGPTPENDTEAKRQERSDDPEAEARPKQIEERENPGKTMEVPAREQDSEPQRPIEIDFRNQSEQQRPIEQEQRVPEQEEPKKEPDWRRIMSDPTYRKQIEQEMTEERANRQQQERVSGQERQGAGGRER